MKELKDFIYKFGAFIEKTTIPKDIDCVPPDELHFELTYNCNTACIMCNLKHLKNKNNKEISFEEIKTFIQTSQYLKNIKFIVLSGGEALLRNDLVDIVKFLRSYYPITEILILSNLFDKKLIVNKLNSIKKEVGLQKISIGSSIDGIGKDHDKIRGQEGAFNNLVSNLELLKQDFPEIYLSLNYTILPDNCNKIVEVYDWCKQNKYHVSFQMFVQKKETQQFVWQNNILNIIEEQINIITTKMANECGIKEFNEDTFLSNEGLTSQFLSLYYIIKYINNQKRYFPNCPCGEKYAMINPFGEVYFCPVYKDKFAGDLRKDSFDTLWNSKQANDIRKFFNSKQCHCWLTCTNGNMLEDAIKSGKNLYIAQKFKTNIK
ncbi:MAG: radical SAM protein [Endomicrobiia bacterium]|nr:radical SAM protein [Endomicrobiaceae bacterium]MDD3053172.1 radical SAM protein [Endomicrobiaceae bacterium]MDD3922055.1 radical SAM protein [Endomicrobiaceae bacterium]MDD5101482.1 radical SAM protein [Endomicrobiaceae bacterium]